MYLSYFDESGDDGYPVYSSQLFILSTIYMHYSNWHDNYQKINSLKKVLYQKYNFPYSLEMHFKEFLQDKNPYHGNYSIDIKRKIIKEFFELISILKIQIINVVIDKSRIKNQDYQVLEKALTYSIQRIENTLNKSDLDSKFIIITDEGRVGKMRMVTRKIQRINFIPSQFYSGSYRKEIKCLIEDPLPKKSNESFFIQLCDCCAYLTYLYACRNLCKPKLEWPKRIQNILYYGEEKELFNLIRNVINLKATKTNEFGIVYYPK
jgi:hypothetical protein